MLIDSLSLEETTSRVLHFVVDGSICTDYEALVLLSTWATPISILLRASPKFLKRYWAHSMWMRLLSYYAFVVRICSISETAYDRIGNFEIVRPSTRMMVLLKNTIVESIESVPLNSEIIGAERSKLSSTILQDLTQSARWKLNTELTFAIGVRLRAISNITDRWSEDNSLSTADIDMSTRLFDTTRSKVDARPLPLGWNVGLTGTWMKKLFAVISWMSWLPAFSSFSTRKVYRNDLDNVFITG